jgi:hypothetical protein
MAEHQLPKLTVRVRFPSSAPENYPWSDTPFPERPDSTAINCGSVGPSTGPRHSGGPTKKSPSSARWPSSTPTHQPCSAPAVPGGPALHRQPPRRSRTTPRTLDRRRARPSRPLHPWTRRRASLANSPGTPARVGGRNRTASNPPHADSRQRTRPPHGRRLGRRPLLAPPRAHAYRTRSAALAARHSRNAACPSGLGAHLAQRSRLVADLADQVQDHAYRGHAEPIWTPPGGHPSTALVGEIAVWRAANGIDPQDPRPTGGTQLETLPALWKQRLDRAIARATYPATDARAEERQAARTALSPRDDTQRPYQRPGQRPNRPFASGR